SSDLVRVQSQFENSIFAAHPRAFVATGIMFEVGHGSIPLSVSQHASEERQWRMCVGIAHDLDEVRLVGILCPANSGGEHCGIVHSFGETAAGMGKGRVIDRSKMTSGRIRSKLDRLGIP